MADQAFTRRASYGPSSPTIGTRGAKTRRQIVDSALGCFTEKGFHATSVDDIATLASTSRATLYQYFESKEAIFVELMYESGGALARVTRRLDRLGPDADGFHNLHWWLGEWSWVYERYAAMFIEWTNVNSPKTSLRSKLIQYVNFHTEQFNALLGVRRLRSGPGASVAPDTGARQPVQLHPPRVPARVDRCRAARQPGNRDPTVPVPGHAGSGAGRWAEATRTVPRRVSSPTTGRRPRATGDPPLRRLDPATHDLRWDEPSSGADRPSTPRRRRPSVRRNGLRSGDHRPDRQRSGPGPGHLLSVLRRQARADRRPLLRGRGGDVPTLRRVRALRPCSRSVSPARLAATFPRAAAARRRACSGRGRKGSRSRPGCWRRRPRWWRG